MGFAVAAAAAVVHIVASIDHNAIRFSLVVYNLVEWYANLDEAYSWEQRLRPFSLELDSVPRT